MLEVKPNKELLKIKSTIFLGLTLWELLWLSIGIVMGTLIYIFVPLPAELKAIVMIPVVALNISVGFVNIDGKNMWQLIISFIKCAYANKHPYTLTGKEKDKWE